MMAKSGLEYSILKLYVPLWRYLPCQFSPFRQIFFALHSNSSKGAHRIWKWNIPGHFSPSFWSQKESFQELPIIIRLCFPKILKFYKFDSNMLAPACTSAAWQALTHPYAGCTVKFRYSEKATNIWPIFHSPGIFIIYFLTCRQRFSFIFPNEIGIFFSKRAIRGLMLTK